MSKEKFKVILWSEDGRSILKKKVSYANARKAVKAHSEHADAMMGENGMYGVTLYGSELFIERIEQQ